MNDERIVPVRSYFTLRELLLVVTLIGLGFAVVVPAIRKSQQAAQRMNCTNHLKQIGVTIHSYHDVKQELCPSYITDDHTPAALPNGFITWPLLSFPYYESNTVYDRIEISVPLDQPVPSPNDHAWIAGSTFSVFVCPARRTVPDHWPNSPFAVGDYANVSLAELGNGVIRAEPRTWDAAMLPSRAFNVSTTFNAAALNGFQPATLGGREYRSMTSFASIIDGLSCTILIGEKAVHQDRLGNDAAYLASTELPSHQDGTFYYGRGGNPANLKAPGAMAYWSRRLAPAQAGERLLADKPRLENPDNRFGGWHEGVTLFVMADGQVKAISNNTSTLVLQRLGSRNDGEKVEVP